MSNPLPEPAPAALDGEVLPPEREVVVKRSPFVSKTDRMVVPAGLSLWEIVEAAGLPPQVDQAIMVTISGHVIPRRHWKRVRPKRGADVAIYVHPLGGGGGGRKNILAAVLSIAVAVAAAYFAPMIAGAMGFVPGTFGFALARGLAGAAITMLGSLLITALVPPPKAESNWGQNSMLASVRNRFAPYADIPRIIGKRRVYPLLASRPYTEAVGSKRWLRVLLAVGMGPLDITNIKIGDTPIGLFKQVTYKVDNGWETSHSNFGSGVGAVETTNRFFPVSVTEDSFSSLLDDSGPSGSTPGPYVTRSTALNTTEASIDVTAPYGVSDQENDGDSNVLKLEVSVEWRATGSSGAWTSVTWDGNDEEDGTDTNGKLVFEEDTDVAIVRGGRWEFPSPGQYDVRLRRLTTRGPGDNNFERLEWTALRSITTDKPVQLKGVACIALKMLATEQFNGLPDTINCEALSYLPSYNGTSWSWGLSRSPAWGYADVLRRRFSKRIIADKHIDVAAIQSWAGDCGATPANDLTGKMWEFNGIIEGGSIFDAMKRIAAAGRAQYAMKDGKHSVVVDRQQSTPVQHITPANSWGYSGSKAFIDQPHALKVNFMNASMGWQNDERLVYADGYDSTNADNFEILDLQDCTDTKQAWREGRYYLAVGKLRPEVHEVYMDVENLRCTVGDRVQFAYDVIGVGLASGRITSRTLDGSGNVTAVTLDETVTLQAASSYALRIRRSGTGTINLVPLATVGSLTTTNTVTLASALAVGQVGAAGDLFTFGQANIETAPMIVKAISPGPDLSARLTLVDYQDGIYTADTGIIPAYNTHINNDTPVDAKRPDAPTVVIHSNRSAARLQNDGSLRRRMAIHVRENKNTQKESIGFRVQARRQGSRQWRDAIGSPSTDDRVHFYVDVLYGQVWEVRALTRGRRGQNSDWTLATHTVEALGRVPSPPTSVSASPIARGAEIKWTKSTSRDASHYEIIEKSTNTTPLVGDSADFETARRSYSRHGLPDNTQRWYWVRTVDRSGNVSAWVAAGSVTTPKHGGLDPDSAVVRRRMHIEAGVATTSGTGSVTLGGLRFPCDPDLATEVEFKTRIRITPQVVSGQNFFGGVTYIQLWVKGASTSNAFKLVKRWRYRNEPNDSTPDTKGWSFTDTEKRSGDHTYQIRLYRTTNPGCVMTFHDNALVVTEYAR